MDTVHPPQSDRDAHAPATWQVVALFFCLTLVFTYPLWVHPASRVLWHGSDTPLFAWTLSWDVHALTHHPWSIFDSNIYHPLRHTLAYSENLIGSAILVSPALLLTGNPIVAINAVSLLTTFLCGLGAWFLARRLGIHPAGAVVAGIVFAFSPPRFLRLGQLHLAAVQWMPFALAFFHDYLDRGRPRDLWLTTAFFSLQALSSGHGTLFLAVSLLGLAVCRALLGEPIAVARRVRDFGVPGLLLILPAVGVLLEYRIVQREMGLTRTLHDWVQTNFASFLTSPSHVDVFIHGHLPGSFPPPQADLFPGYLPLLLALVAFFWPRGFNDPNTPRSSWAPWRSFRSTLAARRRTPVTFYGLLTLVAVWLALPLGRPFGLWPLVYWLPGLNFIRAPSRFTILAVLGLAILSGFACDRLISRLAPRLRTAAGVLLAALVAVEMAAMPLAPVPYRVAIPAVDRWLAQQPTPFVVAEVPVLDPSLDYSKAEGRQSDYMLYSTAHWQKTVHGYSCTRAPLHEALYASLETFPDEQSLKSLLQVGVTRVIVHTDLYPPGEWPEVESRIGQFGDRLTLAAIVGTGRVYALQPAGQAGGSVAPANGAQVGR